jgi:glycosyltransferase involved in cell wall biosynthesis
MIDFQWDHIYLNNILLSISPNLIIDHYSIYLNENNDIYNGIDRTRVIHFVHSALCYKKNIEKLRFLKCIHLYNEKEKEISWNNIKYNYYTTLGTEIIDIHDFDKKTFSEKEILNISIVGRIAEEKNPISFFKKLCESLLLKNNNLKICIYGEKDYVFNKEYVIQFEEILDSFNSTLNKTNNTINYYEFRRDTTEIYKNTDLLLIPSVYETGSFSCLEAFSWGIPVIARNVYGLPYLINHGIEGYLFNSNDEIIDKLLNIKKTDVIFKNREHIIKRVRDKFNIFSKIKDLEIIIDENIEMRNKTNNIIFITSIINCCNKPLSYYHIRSVFDVKTRFLHTLKTIESIRLKIPNSIIFLFECSDLNIIFEEEEHTIETNIKEKVDYYYNFYENDDIRDAVNSSLKGLGEANLLIAGLDKMQEIIEKNNIDYEYLFKISGRYYLNHDFKISDFENSNNNFIQWDNSLCSYSTIFYKIYYYDVSLYKKALLDMMDDLKKENSIECCIYKYFKKRIQVMQKMNVSGLLATEGYLFSI